MKVFVEKMQILFQVCIYGLAAFGGLMLCAYIACSLLPERDYIPMVAILQTIIYIGGVLFAILICLTDFIFTKLNDMVRIGMFFMIIYVLGLTYFQIAAPNGPFDGIRYFISFSVWIITMSSAAFGGWIVYQYCLNRKYNISLMNYQKKLIEAEQEHLE